MVLEKVTAKYGAILTDEEGLTLYRYAADSAGKSVCYGGCAQIWPPLILQSGRTLKGGLGVKGNFGIVDRTDGTRQLSFDGWPLYTFSGDHAPGQANGQGADGSWFVLPASGGVPAAPTASAASAGSATGPGTSTSTGQSYSGPGVTSPSSASSGAYPATTSGGSETSKDDSPPASATTKESEPPQAQTQTQSTTAPTTAPTSTPTTPPPTTSPPTSPPTTQVSGGGYGY